jgi:rhodanese-like protein
VDLYTCLLLPMQKTKLLIGISALLLATLACNALAFPLPSPTPEPAMTTIIEILETPTAGNIPLTEADVPRISPEQAKAAVDSGAAIIIDVRSKEAFAGSHIASAVNIPLANFKANPTGLSLEKDQWIITYCT